MDEKQKDTILEALREGQARFHELAEDHWSHQCCEQSPCIFCQAIFLHKQNRVLFFHDEPHKEIAVKQGRVKRSTLTIGQAERALREDFDPTCVLCEFGEEHEH